LKGIEEMGFETPTEVQGRAIPHVLKNEDLIIISKTGSGKTAVFGVPILQMTDPAEVAAGPHGLILTPTRELAVQVDNDIKLMGKYLNHQTTAVYGQHNINVEIKALAKGVSIVTGTPGRVYDHIRRGNLVTRHVRYLVIDEADRMLDMGFIDQVVRIIKTLPKDRVTLLFSATIPAEVRKICKEYMKQPVTIEIESQTKTVDLIQQVYYRMERNEKRHHLDRILKIERPDSCLIFCNTRIAVDQVQSFLARKGYDSQALHGDIPQGKRLSIVQQFKGGDFRFLVATDVAARGIHIDDLSMVINYDVPQEKDSYVHRIGRTGRAGNTGRSITFVTGEDIMSLYEIEEHIGALIAEEALPSDEMFNANKAEAEKWLHTKSRISESQRLTSVSAAKDIHKKHRDHAGEVKTDHKPSSRRRPAGQKSVQSAAPHPAPAQTVTQTSAKPNAPVKSSTATASARPHPPHTQAAPVVTTIPKVHTEQKGQKDQSSKVAQKQEPAAKKPIIKRLLQKLMGK
jgi:superfamily II DNA/RNA helicase